MLDIITCFVKNLKGGFQVAHLTLRVTIEMVIALATQVILLHILLLVFGLANASFWSAFLVELFFVFPSTWIITIGYCCIRLRNLTILEGTHKYIPEKHPTQWHKKMGYLRIIEKIVPQEVKPQVYRMASFAIGKNVVIAGHISDPDITEIGDNTVVGSGSLILGHSIEGSRIILKKIVVGKNCVVGANSVVMPGVSIGDNAKIGAGAVIPKDTLVDASSTWVGVPAKQLKK